MSTGRPWMAWYPAAIFTDPKYLVLSRSAKLTYRELLDRCWLAGSQLPDDPRKLAALAGMGMDDFQADWKEMQDPEDPCFITHPVIPGFLTNRRIWLEWRKAEEQAEKARNNGKRGGRPPLDNTQEKTKAVISGLAKPNPEKSSLQLQLQEQEEEEKDIQSEPAAPARTAPPPKPPKVDHRPDFEALWSALPHESRHNVSKKQALKSYERARGKATAAEIMAGAQAMATQWRDRPPGVFVPHPPMATTWLNQERWTADYSMPAPEQARGQPAKADAFDLFLAKHQPEDANGPH